jgi:hypothetical protein
MNHILFQPIIRPRLIYGVGEVFPFPIRWRHEVTGYAEVRFCFFDLFVGVSIHYSTPEQIALGRALSEEHVPGIVEPCR